MATVPVKLSTLHYQGVEYIYGKFGDNPIYLVTDMDGKLVGHEGKE